VTEKSLAAGGWCAPSEHIYELQPASRLSADLSFTARRGLDFRDVPRPPKPEPEPLPAAPDGAPAGHWEFGVVLPPGQDTDVAWSDWDFYGQEPNYRTPEEAREGEHYEPGAEIVRRWRPDPFPYEPHVLSTEENEDV